MQTYFLGERNLLVSVCYDVTTIFHFITEEDWGKVEITTLGLGIGAKEREGEVMAVSTWPSLAHPKKTPAILTILQGKENLFRKK